MSSSRRRSPRPVCLTLGVFDGVHRGHTRILRTLVALSRRLGARPVVLTFRRHPAEVLRGEKVPLLMPREESFRRIREAGVREIRLLRFSRAFSRKTPEGFVRWLRRTFPLRGVVVGEGFRFGRGASGDLALLYRLGRKGGVAVVGVKAVRAGGAVVSSTRIRKLLRKGRIGEALRLLGHPYTVEGQVAPGARRGRRLGAPTANLRRTGSLLLADGVYAGTVRIGGRRYHAAVNLGTRPTFGGGGKRLFEVHVLGFRGNLYGRALRVEVWRRLRGERRFRSPAELARQIRRDLARVRRIRI